MERIYCITVPTPFIVGDVHLYIVENEHGLTMVDAGMKTDEAWESFQTQMAELMLPIENIKRIVLTHQHLDHVGLIHYLPEGIPVYGHEQTDRWLRLEPSFVEEHDRFFLNIFKQSGAPGDLEAQIQKMKEVFYYAEKSSLTGFLKEGDSVPGMPDWVALETPGHSQSHLVFYREKDGVMLGGDHLLSDISPNPLLEPSFIKNEKRPRPLVQYRSSLEKLLQYPLTQVLSGHGDVIEDAHRLVVYRLKRLERKQRQIYDILMGKKMSAFELCQKRYAAVYETQFSLVMSEIIGNLDLLLEDGMIVITEEDGINLYSSKVECVLPVK